MISESRIMLGVPTRGRINYNTAQRLLELQAKFPGVTYTLEASGISSAHTRHGLIRRFLSQTECEVLIQIDDDVVPKLSVFELTDSPFDVTGGIYLVVMGGYSIPVPGAFQWDGSVYRVLEQPFGKSGRVPCDGVVAGCLAVTRRVLSHPDMKAPFSIPYSDEGLAASSDDLAFCTRARKAGFTIAADFDQWCDHLPDGASLNRSFDGYAAAYAHAARAERSRPLILG